MVDKAGKTGSHCLIRQNKTLMAFLKFGLLGAGFSGMQFPFDY